METVVLLVVFPVFWLLGALVLTVKLRPIPEELCGKDAEAQADQLRLLEEAEAKWAYRCLAAFVAFLICVAVVIIAVVTTRGH